MAMSASCRRSKDSRYFMNIRLLMMFALAVTAVMSGAPGFAQDSNSDRVTVSWSDPARPGLLKVNLLNGGVTVKTHTGRDVIVDVRSRGAGRRAPAEVGGLRRIDTNASGLRIEEQNNVMTIGSGSFGGRCCSDLEIQV